MQNLIKMTEQTLTLITHNPSFNCIVYNINQRLGHIFLDSIIDSAIFDTLSHIKALVPKSDLPVK